MNNLIQLKKLAVFSMVAKTGSFTKAANQLNLSKSAISQQIKSLENELGVNLIRRTTRSVHLTNVGEKVFQRCEFLQDQVDLMLIDIDEASSSPMGRFSVTFPHALQFNVVIPAIQQLCIEFPGLQPRLIVSDEALDIVENNIDVAIYAGDLPDSGYRALSVGEMTDIFCASPLYINRTSPLDRLEQLDEYRWIAMSWQKKNVSIYESNNKDARKISLRLNRYAQVNALPIAVSMALNHMGIILLPSIAAKHHILNGELMHLLPKYVGPCWKVNLVHAYQGKKPYFVERFHKILKSFFNKL